MSYANFYSLNLGAFSAQFHANFLYCLGSATQKGLSRVLIHQNRNIQNALGNHYRNLEKELGQDIRLLDDSQEEIEMS